MSDSEKLVPFSLLFTQYRFRIPDYQRGYAWGERKNPQDSPKELKELLEDIATLTDENEHFTGLLVIRENPDSSLRIKTRGIVKPVFDVVDGQQRLTTIVILMNEICRAMLEIGTDDLKEIAQDIKETYLFEPGAGSLLVPKLILDENNREFFERNILGIGEKSLLGATMRSHDNLQNAREYFANELKNQREQCQKRGEDFSDWLESLYGKVHGKLKVLDYRLHSDSDAGVIFESMNSRGKKPNSLDLVKNYLLFAASKLEPDLRDYLSKQINQAWTTIFKQLNAAKMADQEERLLEFHWITVYNHDRKNWGRKQEKSDHVKDKFKTLVTDTSRHQELYETGLTYVQTLQNAVIAFTDIYNPNNPGAFQIFETQPAINKEIIRYSEKLVRIGVLRPLTPLLMAVRLRLPDDAQAYLGIVKLCEKYAFRTFRVANSHTNSSEDVLFRLGNQFFNGRITLDMLTEALERDLHNRCGDGTFAQEFALMNSNTWYTAKGARNGLLYLLYEYEEFLHKGNEPTINWKTIFSGGKTIEHILPQNPEADGEWLKRFTPEQVEQYKHTLGNLTLTEDNSKLGRKSFAEKKGKAGQKEACYAISNLRCEVELSGLDDWTPATIENRQKCLAAWATERWFVPSPPPEPDDQLEALKNRAKANGLLNEFEQIYTLAVRLKLIPKPNKNRMAYRSPRDYRWAPIKLYTYASGIELWLGFKYFPVYKNVPEQRIREIFADKNYWWLPPDQIAGFIARLEQLANEVDANQA